MSEIEREFAYTIRILGLPTPEREYRFAAHTVGCGPGIRERLREAGLKDWRFDFAYLKEKIAIEVEGGVWSEGRHVRGQGFIDDCLKYNAATEMGWRVFRYPTGHIEDGALQIKRVLEDERDL